MQQIDSLVRGYTFPMDEMQSTSSAFLQLLFSSLPSGEDEMTVASSSAGAHSSASDWIDSRETPWTCCPTAAAAAGAAAAVAAGAVEAARSDSAACLSRSSTAYPLVFPRGMLALPAVVLLMCLLSMCHAHGHAGTPWGAQLRGAAAPPRRLSPPCLLALRAAARRVLPRVCCHGDPPRLDLVGLLPCHTTFRFRRQLCWMGVASTIVVVHC